MLSRSLFNENDSVKPPIVIIVTFVGKTRSVDMFYVRQKEGNNIDFKFGFLFQT